jgi:glyoxylase-like metal-dependent hydrolase (beta-lactamase superfamily II)
MQEVGPGIYWLSLYSLVNAYLIAIADGLVLVDTGYGWQTGRILRAVEELAGRNGPLRHVMITHGHNDHIGGAAAIRERTGAPIWMHPADARALTEGEGNLAVFPTDRGLPTRIMPGRVQATEVEGALADGIRLPFAPQWQVIHSPGHTAGACCFYNQALKALFIGDAVMHWFGRLSMPFSMATVDGRQNMENVRQVAELDFDLALFGHGPPLRSEGGLQLRRWVAGQKA